MGLDRSAFLFLFASVELRSFKGLIPGFGLLADEITNPVLKIWTLNKSEGYAWFDQGKGIKIPLRPFPGELGIARGAKGAFSTIPPYPTGVH